MYTWLWRHLPGPLPVRLAAAVLLAGGAVLVLFAVVFPWLETVASFGADPLADSSR